MSWSRAITEAKRAMAMHRRAIDNLRRQLIVYVDKDLAGEPFPDDAGCSRPRFCWCGNICPSKPTASGRDYEPFCSPQCRHDWKKERELLKVNGNVSTIDSSTPKG